MAYTQTNLDKEQLEEFNRLKKDVENAARELYAAREREAAAGGFSAYNKDELETEKKAWLDDDELAGDADIYHKAPPAAAYTWPGSESRVAAEKLRHAQDQLQTYADKRCNTFSGDKAKSFTGRHSGKLFGACLAIGTFVPIPFAVPMALYYGYRATKDSVVDGVKGAYYGEPDYSLESHGQGSDLQEVMKEGDKPQEQEPTTKQQSKPSQEGQTPQAHRSEMPSSHSPSASKSGTKVSDRLRTEIEGLDQKQREQRKPSNRGTPNAEPNTPSARR